MVVAAQIADLADLAEGGGTEGLTEGLSELPESDGGAGSQQGERQSTTIWFAKNGAVRQYDLKHQPGDLPCGNQSEPPENFGFRP